MRHAVEAGLPLVCDDDALNVIAEGVVTMPPDIPLIITPPPGERQLADVPTAEINLTGFGGQRL